MALKVDDARGTVFASNLFRAYDYAAAMGAHVTSHSYTSKTILGG